LSSANPTPTHPHRIAADMWSRSFSSLTWRIDLQHSNTAQQQQTASVGSEPLAILQLKLRSPPPALPTSGSDVIVNGSGGKQDESGGESADVDVIMSMDRAAVNSAIAQLDEIDRITLLKAG
jgi:hypothetical protein